MKASNSAITDPCDRSRIFLKTHSVPEFVTPFPPPDSLLNQCCSTPKYSNPKSATLDPSQDPPRPQTPPLQALCGLGPAPSGVPSNRASSECGCRRRCCT